MYISHTTQTLLVLASLLCLLSGASFCRLDPSGLVVHKPEQHDPGRTQLVCESKYGEKLCESIEITWSRSTTVDGSTTDLDVTGDTLDIGNVTLEDEAWYLCQARAEGQNLVSNRVPVLAPPRSFGVLTHEMKPREMIEAMLFEIGSLRRVMNYSVCVSHENLDDNKSKTIANFKQVVINGEEDSSNDEENESTNERTDIGSSYQDSTLFSDISVSMNGSGVLFLELTRRSIYTGSEVDVNITLIFGQERFREHRQIKLVPCETREVELELQLQFDEGTSCQEHNVDDLLHRVQELVDNIGPCYNVTLSADELDCDNTPTLQVTVHYPSSADFANICRAICNRELSKGVKVIAIEESPTTDPPTTTEKLDVTPPDHSFVPWKIACVAGFPVLLIIIVSGCCVWIIRSCLRNRDHGNRQRPLGRGNPAVRVQPFTLELGVQQAPYRPGNNYIEYSPMGAQPGNLGDLNVEEVDNDDVITVNPGLHAAGSSPHYHLVVPQLYGQHRPCTANATARLPLEYCPPPNVPCLSKTQALSNDDYNKRILALPTDQPRPPAEVM